LEQGKKPLSGWWIISAALHYERKIIKKLYISLQNNLKKSERIAE